jgi:predicted P-loop ATPase/GTPase
MPNLLSHYIDGSRHDYRAAAEAVVQNARGTEPVILSDDAETISYYLPEALRNNLFVRTKARRYPPSEFFLVTRANAWAPLPRIPQRQMELVAEIYRRRLDEFSHILRVYRIAPGPAVDSGY